MTRDRLSRAGRVGSDERPGGLGNPPVPIARHRRADRADDRLRQEADPVNGQFGKYTVGNTQADQFGTGQPEPTG